MVWGNTRRPDKEGEQVLPPRLLVQSVLPSILGYKGGATRSGRKMRRFEEKRVKKAGSPLRYIGAGRKIEKNTTNYHYRECRKSTTGEKLK